MAHSVPTRETFGEGLGERRRGLESRRGGCPFTGSSGVFFLCFLLLLVLTYKQQRINYWILNHNRKTTSGDDTSRSVIDLSGKSSRKKAKITRAQAYSAIYYKPFASSVLRTAVTEAWTLYSSGDEDMVVRFSPFLNPKALPDKPLVKKLAFQQAYMREVVQDASPELLLELDEYITRRWEQDNAVLATPWLLKSGTPESTEIIDTRKMQNEYYQRYVHLLDYY